MVDAAACLGLFAEYIDAMKSGRVFAAVAALAVATQGGGVPMCVSLLAEAAAPCAMHSTGVHRTHNPGAATIVAASAEHGACHVDAATPGCAVGGTCPTGGTAAPAWINNPIAPRAAFRTVAAGPASALISFLAPPLAPPPQA